MNCKLALRAIEISSFQSAFSTTSSNSIQIAQKVQGLSKKKSTKTPPIKTTSQLRRLVFPFQPPQTLTPPASEHHFFPIHFSTATNRRNLSQNTNPMPPRLEPAIVNKFDTPPLEGRRFLLQRESSDFTLHKLPRATKVQFLFICDRNILFCLTG